MMAKLQRILWVAAIAFVAGRAGALPPLPSIDGVVPIPNGTVPTVRKTPGTVTASTTGKTLDITSTSKRFVIDWTSFNIDPTYRVNFAMPDRASIGVNRVTGVGSSYLSTIAGDLWSNGNVWLLNPNGVLFSGTARVDVGGLLAAPAYFYDINQFIRADGTYDARLETNGTLNSVQPLVRFDMAGSVATGADFDTAVLRPGPVTIENGAKVLTRGGPAVFVVGSAATGRVLTVGGTVTGKSSEFGGATLTYSGSPENTTSAEETSSQVVYAASGDFAIELLERPITGQPPDPLVSGDLDLFQFHAYKGVGGLLAGEVAAPNLILVEESAKTVAGQVAVIARGEYSSDRLRYLPDFVRENNCSPALPECVVPKHPTLDTWSYDPILGYGFLCGPGTGTCATVQGTGSTGNYSYSNKIFTRTVTTTTVNYGCSPSPCVPGVRIRSSLVALDSRPEGSSPVYGATLRDSLIVNSESGDASTLGNRVIEKDLVTNRPIEIRANTALLGSSVTFDPRGATPGSVAGVTVPVALRVESAGKLAIAARDICVTLDGTCYQNGVSYAATDAYTAPTFAGVRFLFGTSGGLTASRLVRLEESVLSGASINLGYVYSIQNALRDANMDVVLRNGLVNPNAGNITGTGGNKRVTIGTSIGASNDVRVGSLDVGARGADVNVGGAFIVQSPATTPYANVIYAGSVTITANGIFVGDFLGGALVAPVTIALNSRSNRAEDFVYGTINGYLGLAVTASLTSGADIDFNPTAKLGSTRPSSLLLNSTAGRVCLGTFSSGSCNATDLELSGSVELRGATSVTVRDIFTGTGSISLFSSNSVVSTRDVAAGSSTGNFDVIIDAQGISSRKIDAKRDVSLTVRGATSEPDFDSIDAVRNIFIGTVGNYALAPSKIKSGTKVKIQSSAGEVCIGNYPGNSTTCQAQNFSAQGVALSVTAAKGFEVGNVSALSFDARVDTGQITVGTISVSEAVNGLTSTDPCVGRAVCLRALEPASSGNTTDSISTGSISAATGSVLLSGPRRVTTGAISADAGNVKLTSMDGRVKAGAIATGEQSAYFVEATGSELDLSSINAKGAISLKATGTDKELTAGALTAGLFVEAESLAGNIVTGQITAGGTKSLANDPCNGLGVCIRAGPTATTGTQVATVGQVSSSGNVLVQGRTGVETKGTITASAGSVTLTSQAGDVDADAGKISAGYSTGDYDVTVTGQSVRVADVEARDDVTLSATGTVGTLSFYNLTVTDVLTLSTASTLNFDLALLGSSTLSELALTSTAGGVCIGSVSGGNCTPGAFNRSSTSLTVSAVNDIRIGDVTAKSGKFDSSAGSITLGNVVATGTASNTGYVVARTPVGAITVGNVTASGIYEPVLPSDQSIYTGFEGVCSTRAVCLDSGRESGTIGVGNRRVTAGNINTTGSNTGTINVSGRDGVQVGSVTGKAWIQLSALQGPVTASGNISSSNTLTYAGLNAQNRSTFSGVFHDVNIRGQSISLQDVTSANDLVAIYYTSGGGTGNISVGNVSAGMNVNILTPIGSVTTGNISARSDYLRLPRDILYSFDIYTTNSNFSCALYTICIHAGGISGGPFAYALASSGTQSITTGAISTTNAARSVYTNELIAGGSSILLSGRSGVKTNSTVTAAAGSVSLTSSAGTVDTEAGKITAGTTTGDYDVTITGQSVKVANVEARDDITLSATGTAGVLTFGNLSLTDVLKLTAPSQLNFDLARLGSSSLSELSLTSTAGGVCIGSISGSNCTPGVFNRSSTSLFVSAVNDIRIGDVTAKSGKFDSSAGSITLGNVVATGTTSGTGYLVARTPVGSITVGNVTAEGRYVSTDTSSASNPETACGSRAVCLDAAFFVGTVGIGSRKVTAGDIVATDSSARIRVSGRDGVQVGSVTGKSRVWLSALNGDVVATGNIFTSYTSTPEAGFPQDINIRGRSISLLDVTSGNDRVSLYYTSGGGTGNISTGNISAGRNVHILTPAGSVTTGTITARSDYYADPSDTLFLEANYNCRQYAVCIHAGGISGGTFTYTPSTTGTQSITTGAITTTNRPRDASTNELIADGGGVILSSRTGVTTTGAVAANNGTVRLNALAGGISTGTSAVSAGDSVDIQAGVKTTSTAGEDPYVTDAGTFNVAVGSVTANNGTLLINARDGITANAVTQSRTSTAVPSVPEVDLQTKSGSVKATGVNSKGYTATVSDPGTGGRLRVVAPQGIELSFARGSDVELTAQTGNVRIGTQSAQFNPGSITATTGDVTASARSIEVGKVNAARDLALTASEGVLTTDTLTATRNLTLSAANSLAVNTSAISTLSGNVSLSSTAGSLCVGTRSGADCVAGDVIAGGTVNLAGRDGVTASNVRASGGNLSISAASGGVTVNGIEAAAATSAGRADVNVTARDNVQVRSRTVSGQTVGGSVGAEGNVSISSAQGAITVDREIGASKGFAQLAAQTGVTTGNITSLTGFVDVQAKAGPVQVGDLYGLVGKPASTTGPADPCAGNVICVQAGTGGTATSTTNYTVTTGTIETDNTASGNVLVGGANGVQTGAIDINNGSVALNSSQGAITVGSVGLSGSSVGKSVVANARGKVTIGNIVAGSGSIDLQSANDELVLARVSGGGDVRLRSAANLTVDLSKVDAGGVASFTSTGGELRVGTVSGSNFTPGDLNQTLGAVELSGQTGVTVGNVAARDGASLQSAAGSINAGEVLSSGGAVQVTAANDVNLRRAQGTAATIASNTGRIRVGTTSGSTFVGGNVNATTGAASVTARTGVETADITGGTTTTVNVAEGAVVARALFAGNGAAFVSGRDGVSVASASAPNGSIDLIANQGAVKAGSTSGSTFSGGQVNAGRGGVRIDARDEIATGNVTASSWVKIGSESSKVSLGNVSASAAHTSDDECSGKSVCIGAAFDSANGSGQTLTVGSVTASAGDVLLFGRNGVTANGAVTASRGELVVSGGSGAVTASGALTTGTGATTDANYGVKVDGTSLALQNVTASGNIDLAGSSASGTITTGTLAARRNLTVQSIGGFAVGGDKIAGTPESVRLTSSGGSVCVGTVVDGRCTGSTLTRDTTLVIDGATGVTTGDLSVRSVNVSAAGGSATLGQLTTTGAVSVSARDALSARGVAAAGSVQLASTNDAIRVTEAITSQQGSVTVAAKGAVETGNVTAGTFLDVQARAGSLKTGNLAARSAQTATSTTGNTTNPCIGMAICIQTGTDSTATNAAAFTASVGTVEAAAGNVRLDGRGGVEAGSVLASAGSVAFSSSDGGVRAAAVRAAAPVSVVTASAATVASEVPRSTVAVSVSSASVEALAKGSIILGDVTSAGAVTLQSVEGSGGVTAGSIDAGTSATVTAAQGTVTLAKVAAKSGDLKIVGKNAVKTGDVTGGAGVEVSSESGALEAGAVNAVGVAKLAGASGVKAASAKGSSVDATSSGGSVAVTGAVTSTTAGVKLDGRDGVTSGAIDAATSATVTAAQGVVTLANVAAKAGDLKVVGKNAVKTGDVTGSAAVDLVSESAMLESSAVNAGGVAKLAGASGVTVASIKGTSVDAQSSGGGVTVGTGAGSSFVAGTVTATSGAVNVAASKDVIAGVIDAATSATVTAAQGAVTLANVAAKAGDLKVVGKNAVKTGDVTGGAGVEVSSESGALEADAVNAVGVAKLAGASGVKADSAKGSSVDATSSGGSVAVTGAVTSTTAGVKLDGRDGVTSGAIDAATSATVSAAQGAVTLANVAAKSGDLKIVGKNAVKTGDVTGSAAVDLVSESGTLESSAVNAGGVAKLAGASGIKLASIRGGAVDATSSGGSVAVTGAVT
ncbi:MAG: hypothetical protein RL580_1218, partial [Pseudomonadota bacterium]